MVSSASWHIYMQAKRITFTQSHKEETTENNIQRKESQGKRNMNEWNTTGGEGVFYIVNHARPKGTPGQEGLFPGTAYY